MAPRSPKQITLTHESAIRREKQTGRGAVSFCHGKKSPPDSFFFFLEERKESAGDVFADALAPAVRGDTLGTPDADARRGVGVHVQ